MNYGQLINNYLFLDGSLMTQFGTMIVYYFESLGYIVLVFIIVTFDI